MSRVVSREEWLRARTDLLRREKELTRLRDELAAARRVLPWERVTGDYVFQGPDGDVRLVDLFAGRRQLLVYHFMFGPDWEKGCKSCSFWADGFNLAPAHLAQRDVSFVAISRAPLERLRAFAGRMGWTFPWVSSGRSHFNFDYAVSFEPRDVEQQRLAYNFGTSRPQGTEMPGFSCFWRDDDGTVCHTYSTCGRGLDPMNPVYQLLDLTPLGRDEDGLSSPMAWVRLRDDYDG